MELQRPDLSGRYVSLYACLLFFCLFFCLSVFLSEPGAGIMEADDRQVTTVFTVNRHSTIGTRQSEYHEALPSSPNDDVRCDCTFGDDGNAS